MLGECRSERLELFVVERQPSLGVHPPCERGGPAAVARVRPVVEPAGVMQCGERGDDDRVGSASGLCDCAAVVGDL
jgi:hypothetical protein